MVLNVKGYRGVMASLWLPQVNSPHSDTAWVPHIQPKWLRHPETPRRLAIGFVTHKNQSESDGGKALLSLRLWLVIIRLINERAVLLSWGNSTEVQPCPRVWLESPTLCSWYCSTSSTSFDSPVRRTSLGRKGLALPRLSVSLVLNLYCHVSLISFQ